MMDAEGTGMDSRQCHDSESVQLYSPEQIKANDRPTVEGLGH